MKDEKNIRYIVVMATEHNEISGDKLCKHVICFKCKQKTQN